MYYHLYALNVAFMTYFPLSLSLRKRKHAIAMVERGTTEEKAHSAVGQARPHPHLTPMTSTSSLQYLIDDDTSGTVINNNGAQ